jgi:hypothetical protein
MRRVAFLVATPLRADDASEIAYTLKDALMPTYRMSSDPSALQATLLAQKANEKSRGSLAPLPLRETPGDGLSFRVKRLCDLIGAIPLLAYEADRPWARLPQSNTSDAEQSMF